MYSHRCERPYTDTTDLDRYVNLATDVTRPSSRVSSPTLHVFCVPVGTRQVTFSF